MIDLEATASQTLRADSDIDNRVDGRVWLNMPAKPAFPAILIRRTGGVHEVAFQGAVFTDQAELDLHCYGGSRVEALTLAQRALTVLCGATDTFTAKPFSLLRIPDSTMPQDNGRDRERYILTVSVAGH